MEEQHLGAKDVKKIMKEEEYIKKEDARRHSSMHVAAFVLGLLTVLGHLFWYISLPCGVLAIIFGAKSAKKLGSKLGKAGLILGIIGLAGTILTYAAIISISFLAWL